jgi:ATP-dependent Zn protease
MLFSLFSAAHQRTKDLLTTHREDVEKVAKLLLDKEVITRYVFIIHLLSLWAC